MKILTTRFGELDVETKDILLFKEGILGFENLTEFFIVDPGDKTLILWLQSTQDGKIAFPLIEPKIFYPEYSLTLAPYEYQLLQLEQVNQGVVYSILTIPKDITKMSANLKAPLVINNTKRLGRQVVLQDHKLPVRFEMYKELKKYIVSFNPSEYRRTEVPQMPISPTFHETGAPPVIKRINPELSE